MTSAEGDPLALWREPLRQFQAAVAAMAGQSDVAQQLTAPMRAQADLFERALQQQSEVQANALRGVFEPFTQHAHLLSEVGTSMSQQADLFDSAAEALGRAATLLRTQAGLFERATEPLRRQAEAVERLTGLGKAAPDTTT